MKLINFGKLITQPNFFNVTLSIAWEAGWFVGDGGRVRKDVEVNGGEDEDEAIREGYKVRSLVYRGGHGD